MLNGFRVEQVKWNQLIQHEAKYVLNSEGISVSKDLLNEEWESFENSC